MCYSVCSHGYNKDIIILSQQQENWFAPHCCLCLPGPYRCSGHTCLNTPNVISRQSLLSCTLHGLQKSSGMRNRHSYMYVRWWMCLSHQKRHTCTFWRRACMVASDLPSDCESGWYHMFNDTRVTVCLYNVTEATYMYIIQKAIKWLSSNSQIFTLLNKKVCFWHTLDIIKSLESMNLGEQILLIKFSGWSDNHHTPVHKAQAWYISSHIMTLTHKWLWARVYNHM